MLARLSTKGQVVIPKAVRKALGLRRGTQFRVELKEGKIILEPMGASPSDVLCGKYAGADFLTALEEEHRQEIRDEASIRA